MQINSSVTILVLTTHTYAYARADSFDESDAREHTHMLLRKWNNLTVCLNQIPQQINAGLMLSPTLLDWRVLFILLSFVTLRAEMALNNEIRVTRINGQIYSENAFIHIRHAIK